MLNGGIAISYHSINLVRISSTILYLHRRRVIGSDVRPRHCSFPPPVTRRVTTLLVKNMAQHCHSVAEFASPAPSVALQNARARRGTVTTASGASLVS